MRHGAARRRGLVIALALCLGAGTTGIALAASSGGAAGGATPPSVFGVDAPELAPPGPYGVGLRKLHLVQPAQQDVLAIDPATGAVPLKERALDIDLFYPAVVKPGAPRVMHEGAMRRAPPESTAVHFTVPGIAVRDAKAGDGPFPLVVVSHGWGNVPAALTWLTENLASKGYVVAAIDHDDPPYGVPRNYPVGLLRRPLDIAFVTASLQKSLAAEHLVDPERTVLLGFSFGGYGVLTAAGAAIDPKGRIASQYVPAGLLLPYARGGDQRDAVRVSGLRAVVAMAPWGGGALGAWDADGIGELSAPLLVIDGDQDFTARYDTGVRAIFNAATRSQRYLLTYHGAGHGIGLNPAPAQMRSTLWDQDWFTDPLWRPERVNAINAHFITAFLDRYVKGDETRTAYLDVREPESSKGVWAATSTLPYDAFSPGDGDYTVWKGFQRFHATGMALERADPAH